MSNDDLTPSPLEGGSAAAAGKSREVELRERLARMFARRIPDAFCSTHAKLDDCPSRFPEDFSAAEVALFNSLADRVLDELRLQPAAAVERASREDVDNNPVSHKSPQAQEGNSK